MAGLNKERPAIFKSAYCIQKNCGWFFSPPSAGFMCAHGGNNLPILPAMAYIINDLEIQRANQRISKLEMFFTKYVPHTMPIFEKKKSHLKRPVE